MAVRRNIFLIALLCSLGLHLGSVGVYLGIGKWRAKFVHHDHDLAAALTPKAAEQEMIVYPDMGEATGAGIGSNSSPGDKPLQAREADEDQAMLDRRPTGNPQGAPVPTPVNAPPGEGRGGTPQAREVAQALRQAVQELTRKLEQKAAEIKNQIPAPPVEPVAPPLPKVEKAQIPAVPEKTEVVKVAPPPVATPPPAPAPTLAKPVQVARSADEGDARTPGAVQPIGQPLPQNESDSDPFSRISGSVRVINGRLDARLGREVHTTRPQLDVSARLDLLALNNPIVVVEVHIAATGKVVDVKVAHSSGSNQIDEPTRVAVYDWRFEPARDKKGRAVPDVIFFSIQYLD